MHIVRAPAPPGQGGDPPKVRKPRTRSLTDGEAMRLGAALRHLRGLYGTWKCLGEVMGMHPSTLQDIAGGGCHPGANVARRAAKAAGKSLDALIGGLKSADVCPTCGRGAS